MSSSTANGSAKNASCGTTTSTPTPTTTPTTPTTTTTVATDLEKALQIVDAVLQFLVRATGQPWIQLGQLQAALPNAGVVAAIPSLVRDYGVLSIRRQRQRRETEERLLFFTPTRQEARRNGYGNAGSEDVDHVHFDCEDYVVGPLEEWTVPQQIPDRLMVGFPPPPTHIATLDGVSEEGEDGSSQPPAAARGRKRQKRKGSNESKTKDSVKDTAAVAAKQRPPQTSLPPALHGPTKTAAKRRLAALRRGLKQQQKLQPQTKPPTQQQQQETEGMEDLTTRETLPAPLEDMQEEEAATEEQQLTPPPRLHRTARRVGESERFESTAPVTPPPNAFAPGASTTTTADTTTAQPAMVTPQPAPVEESVEQKEALAALEQLFQRPSLSKAASSSSSSSADHAAFTHLPHQAAFAGSHPWRPLRYGFLDEATRTKIPLVLSRAFGLDLQQQQEPTAATEATSTASKLLYHHQAQAVQSVLEGIHTMVCTGTGSGKSLCFLLPVLTALYHSAQQPQPPPAAEEEETAASSVPSPRRRAVALLLFPTKALAQDQYSKLQRLLAKCPELSQHIRAATLDGDTPHAHRSAIAQDCHIIMTNPDTLHAALLPSWKAKHYSALLAQTQFVVLDEAHVYSGTFGAHVSFILARLVRLCAVARRRRFGSDLPKRPTFVACSASMGEATEEEYFRLLCPIAPADSVRVLTSGQDGSPCAAKHFFVWNPTILNPGGVSAGTVLPKRTIMNTKKRKSSSTGTTAAPNVVNDMLPTAAFDFHPNGAIESDAPQLAPPQQQQGQHPWSIVRRRHAADETARLLALAITRGIRTIAFCKTRSVVEWVYAKCVATLKADPSTASLADLVESYRGGYTAKARRDIEGRLFGNQLLAVVGTCALELGVDVGGMELTLHCGWPGSYHSLLQQAGRAGRGVQAAQKPSFAMVIVFNSPAEQHLWRHPRGILHRGLEGPPALPRNITICQGHLLCAAAEWPLVGANPATVVMAGGHTSWHDSLCSDHDLFGTRSVYEEALDRLVQRGMLCQETVQTVVPVGEEDEEDATTDKSGVRTMTLFSAHPSTQKAWSRVSIRSIEAIQYKIVDMSHAAQGGRTDAIHDEAAVLDNIPYSRVFYHAFPGAIIFHRGQKYKVHSMNAPPPLLGEDLTLSLLSSASYSGRTLGAYVEPTTAPYITRALSILVITPVKQFEQVNVVLPCEGKNTWASDAVAENKSPTSPPGLSNAKTAPVDELELTGGPIAGSGVVTVKRTVHGYKKLSPITRSELSRTAIIMPPQEFDTNALWLDVDAPVLREVVKDFDAGVHALSHAILAVIPLFVPCSGDLDCDHSHHHCTRVLLFDTRAGGGGGTTASLWRHLFRPQGILDAALHLLEHCPTCGGDVGCPGCLHSGPCLNYNSHLSRKAARHIARRMKLRIEQTELYQRHCAAAGLAMLGGGTAEEEEEGPLQWNSTAARPPSFSTKKDTTPRRLARAKNLWRASDLESARQRQIVVGRATWPLADT